MSENIEKNNRKVTVVDVFSKRVQFEIDLTDMIRDFEKETSCKIDSIKIKRKVEQSVNSGYIFHITGSLD